MVGRSATSFLSKYVIICEDIRQEDNGKFILIGVYSSDIRVAHFPSNLGLSFWISGTTKNIGQVPIEFRIKHDKTGFLSGGKGVMNIEIAGEDSIFVIGRTPVEVHEEGVLSLQLKEKGGNWHTLKKIPVVLNPKQS